MFAVIRTGGKQHRVISGERLKIEKLVGDVGAELEFDDILMVGGEELKIGQPLVEGANVKAKIVAHGRGKKVKVFKKKRRKGFHKMIGHRQSFTEVEITEISA